MTGANHTHDLPELGSCQQVRGAEGHRSAPVCLTQSRQRLCSPTRPARAPLHTILMPGGGGRLPTAPPLQLTALFGMEPQGRRRMQKLPPHHRHERITGGHGQKQALGHPSDRHLKLQTQWREGKRRLNILRTRTDTVRCPLQDGRPNHQALKAP